MNIIAEIKSRLRGPIPIFLEAVPDKQLAYLRQRAEAGTLAYFDPSNCLMGVVGEGSYQRGRDMHPESYRTEKAFAAMGGLVNRDALRNAKVLPMVVKEQKRRVVTTVEEGELVAK